MELENWKHLGNALLREFEFKNQTELAEFILKIARYSDELDHHSDMEISQCRKLRISISTHDANGLTDLDYSWAKGLNDLIA